MPEEPDNMVLQLLGTMRAENSARFGEIEALLQDVRLTVVRHDLRFDALEESVEAIHEGAVSAIGFPANASRAHIDLRPQIADLTRRLGKLEVER
jgi:hypothetical protein